jgi:hypothetical protein
MVIPDRLDFDDPDTTTIVSAMLRSSDTAIQIEALTQYADVLRHAHRHFEGPLGLLLEDVVAVCQQFLTMAPEQALAPRCWNAAFDVLAHLNPDDADTQTQTNLITPIVNVLRHEVTFGGTTEWRGWHALGLRIRLADGATRTQISDWLATVFLDETIDITQRRGALGVFRGWPSSVPLNHRTAMLSFVSHREHPLAGLAGLILADHNPHDPDLRRLVADWSPDENIYSGLIHMIFEHAG